MSAEEARASAIKVAEELGYEPLYFVQRTLMLECDHLPSEFVWRAEYLRDLAEDFETAASDLAGDLRIWLTATMEAA